MFFGAGEPRDMLRDLAGKVCQIHVKDGTPEGMGNRPLGAGHGSFPECAEAIRETGYQGWIVLENEYKGFRRDHKMLMKRDIARMKEAFA